MLDGEAARKSARAMIKAAVRGVGEATASSRPLPDFLLIGTKRGGTTSFYYDLLEHPAMIRLFPRPVPGLKKDATKGVHYFDSNFTRGIRWYRSHFPTAATRAIVSRRRATTAVTGEASPYYMFHPAGAERVHTAMPDIRLLVLLRDPVERAYSHWKERRRGGAEPLDFLSAIEAEPARLAGERARLLADPGYVSYAWEQQSYITQSRYSESLRPWVERFGLNRIMVLASEDYYADPVRVLGDVDEFLGLPRRSSSSAVIRNAAPGADLTAEIRHRLELDLSSEADRLTELLGRTFPWS